MDALIEAVRKYPCLWNTTAIEYKDQELKDAAWAEVMKETDLSSVKEVKLKWKKLRDSYRDALKRQSDTAAREPGQPARRSYHWKYMASMQFLQPHMGARKKAADSPPPAAHNGRALASSDDDQTDDEPPPRRARAASPLAALDRKLDLICRSLGEPRAARDPERRRDPPPPPDPLDIFFNGMCQATKRLPYPTQIKIKKTLFAAVVEAEEAYVAEQQSLASLWAGAGGAGAGGSSSEPSSPP